MEFISSCYTIRQLEDKICKPLVEKKQAWIIKDSSDGNSQGYTVHYLLQVGEDSLAKIVFGSTFNKVNVRFWYDQRIDRASVKITKEGMEMIIGNVRLLGMLQSLNLKIGNGKGISPDAVKALLRQADERQIEIKP